MQGVTSAQAPQLDIKFEPTLVIAAGKIDRMGMEFAHGFIEPLTKAIHDIVAPSIAKNFVVGGRPKWEPLSEASLHIRDYYGVGHSRPLFWTTALYDAARSVDIWTITKGYATINDLPSNVWYGKIHQAGYEGKQMSARMKANGGNAKAALESLMDEQYSKIGGKIGKGRATKYDQKGGGPIDRKGASGTMGGGGASPIPARPFVMFQPEDEDAISELFIKWMEEQVDKHWPKGLK
jgi:phage gpG-like protein